MRQVSRHALDGSYLHIRWPLSIANQAYDIPPILLVAGKVNHIQKDRVINELCMCVANDNEDMAAESLVIGTEI